MFFENLKAICKEKNTSPTAVALAVGMAKSNVTGWKNGQEPSIMTAVKIANHLGVDVSDLSKEIAQQKSNFEHEMIGYRNGRADEKEHQNYLMEKEKSPAPEGVEQDEDTIELLEIWRTGDAADREFLLASARMLKARRK